MIFFRLLKFLRFAQNIIIYWMETADWTKNVVYSWKLGVNLEWRLQLNAGEQENLLDV